MSNRNGNRRCRHRSDDRCRDCRFFDFVMEDDGNKGFCKRYPPIPARVPVAISNSDLDYEYPYIDDGEWCGEFSAFAPPPSGPQGAADAYQRPPTQDERRGEL